MDTTWEEYRKLKAVLSHSQELLRQAVALLAEVDRQQIVNAQTLATIRQKVLESQQFRAEHRHLLEYAELSDEHFSHDLD